MMVFTLDGAGQRRPPHSGAQGVASPSALRPSEHRLRGKARWAATEKHRLETPAAPLNRVLRSTRSVLRRCWRIVPPNKPVRMARQKIQIRLRRSLDEPPIPPPRSAWRAKRQHAQCLDGFNPNHTAPRQRGLLSAVNLITRFDIMRHPHCLMGHHLMRHRLLRHLGCTRSRRRPPRRT